MYHITIYRYHIKQLYGTATVPTVQPVAKQGSVFNL